MSWQRTNIQAAATYLRERIAAGATDTKTKTVYEGLLEVLDPNRRTARMQRELLSATQASVPVAASRDRRSSPDRRTRGDRRAVNAESPTGEERRSGRERRTGRERRNG